MLILFLAAWFWLDSMGKRERAILLGGGLAARYNLQLLDEAWLAPSLAWGATGVATCNSCAVMHLM